MRKLCVVKSPSAALQKKDTYKKVFMLKRVKTFLIKERGIAWLL